MLLAVGADYSFTWPSGGELVAAGVQEVYWYCGPARPPVGMIQDWDAHGLAQVAIFETYSEQAQSDRATGQANARYLRARVAEVGKPDIVGAYVMSDGNYSSPSGPLLTISDYAAGVADIEQREFIAYGNEYAVSAAMRGTPLATVDWIPETWTSRSEQGIRQLVGPVPINGIDLNHRYVPLPGQGPVAAKPRGGVHGMWIALRRNPTTGIPEAIKCAGLAWVADVPSEPRGLYGIPQQVYDLHANEGIHYEGVDNDTWDRCIGNAQASNPVVIDRVVAAIKAIPAGSGGGGSTLTEAQLVAAVKEGIAGAPIRGTVTATVGA